MMQPRPIQRLDPSVVNRIAAGEVVQRPASAIKELMENSLDAGATSINISCKQGGIKALSISDNGHGIAFVDLPLLCERFATSKIRQFEDLNALHTFGFRGEALASISHVALVNVHTKTEGAECAYRANYRDGLLVGEPVPCAGVRGTTILVEDLFYNMATRRNFLNNPAEEYSKIVDVVRRYAIHYPHIAFSCKKTDGVSSSTSMAGSSSSDITTRGGRASRIDVIGSLYGSSISSNLLQFEDTAFLKDVTISFVATNANYSSKKTTLVLFINNRLVEHSRLRKAIDAFYVTVLPNHAHPWMYLSLTLPPETVDANIHPTKMEVAFLDEDAIMERVLELLNVHVGTTLQSKNFVTQQPVPATFATAALERDPKVARIMLPYQLDRTEHTQLTLDTFLPTSDMRRLLDTGADQRDLSKVKPNASSSTEEQQGNPSIPSAGNFLRRSFMIDHLELDSLDRMERDIVSSADGSLTELFQKHVFVGLANRTFSLLQFRTRLYMFNHMRMSRIFAEQACILRFGRFPASLRLSKPPLLVELLPLSVDQVNMLLDRKEMLMEYLLMEIDDDGRLHSVPLLFEGFIPPLIRLPRFIKALVNDVDWTEEGACFRSICTALGAFFCLPCRESEFEPDDPSQASAAGSQSYRLSESRVKHYLSQFVMPASRTLFFPPAAFAKEILEVASLDRLYKVFERC